MNQISQAIAEAIKRGGSRKMRVTFKPAALADVPTLCGMDQGGIIDIGQEDAIALTSVMRESQWDGLPNRTVTVKAADHFDAAEFENFADGAFESVEAVAT